MISGYDVRDKNEAFQFLLGVILNQQIQAERAWNAPRELLSRLSASEIGQAEIDSAGLLLMVPPDVLLSALTTPTHLHPFAEAMSLNFQSAAEVVSTEFAGDARRIWARQPTSELVMSRLQQIRGIGRHKAEVAVYLLAVEQAVPLADHVSPTLAAGCARLHAHFGESALA